MIKLAFSSVAVLSFVCLGTQASEAQVVTSYYAGAAPVAPLTYTAYSPGQFLAAPTVAAVAPVYTANRFSGAIYGAPVIGVVPVRQGLFGLRTAYVPVVASTTYALPAATMVAPVAAYPAVAAYPTVATPYAAARPVISTVPYGTTGYSGPVQAAYPAATYAPNAVIQSGFRGTSPSPVYAAPLQYTPTMTAPTITAPVVSFYPGAVMSMQ